MNKFGSIMNVSAKHFLGITVIIGCAVVCISATLTDQKTEKEFQVPYPEGYRNWTLIKTALLGLGNNPEREYDGFHNIYANDKAMIGYKTGHFPDGSYIIFDKQKVDSIFADSPAGKKIFAGFQPGERKFIDVMYKDSLAFHATGGWGFEKFHSNSKTEGRMSIEKQQTCFKSCHVNLKDKGFVYTQFKF